MEIQGETFLEGLPQSPSGGKNKTVRHTVAIYHFILPHILNQSWNKKKIYIYIILQCLKEQQKIANRLGRVEFKSYLGRPYLLY